MATTATNFLAGGGAVDTLNGGDGNATKPPQPPHP
jgi:hypothetical protein